jgi:hypothetical protein
MALMSRRAALAALPAHSACQRATSKAALGLPSSFNQLQCNSRSLTFPASSAMSPHVLPVPLGDYDLGNCNFRRANGFIEKGLGSRRRAPKRSIRSASNNAACEFRWAGEIRIIAQTPPQPHIGCVAVALSHLHGSEEVVVAIIDRRVAITGAAPPLQDQVAVIKAADIT